MYVCPSAPHHQQLPAMPAMPASCGCPAPRVTPGPAGRARSCPLPPGPPCLPDLANSSGQPPHTGGPRRRGRQQQLPHLAAGPGAGCSSSRRQPPLPRLPPAATAPDRVPWPCLTQRRPVASCAPRTALPRRRVLLGASRRRAVQGRGAASARAPPARLGDLPTPASVQHRLSPSLRPRDPLLPRHPRSGLSCPGAAAPPLAGRPPPGQHRR